MFIQTIFRKLKIYFYSHIDQEIHKDLQLIFKCNKVNAKELLEICSAVTDYYSVMVEKKNLEVTAIDKVFLLLIQDIINFFTKLNDPSISYSLLDILKEYKEYKDIFIEDTKNVMLKLMQKKEIYEVVTKVCTEQSFLKGDVIEFIAGHTKDLNKIEIDLYDYESKEDIAKRIDSLFAVEDLNLKQYLYSPTHHGFILYFSNMKIYITLQNKMALTLNHCEFTIETVNIHIPTYMVIDPYYALYDIQNKFLVPCGTFVVKSPHLTTSQNIMHETIHIDKKIVLKYFKYSKIYKSKKRLKRFMKNCFRYRYKDFNAQEMLQLTEDLLKG